MPDNEQAQSMRNLKRAYAPREALDPGEGMSCWAKHCAVPAPNRHTALRRFPKRRTQGVVSPTGRECQFLRGARIPHAVCENTTRGGPRKGPLPKAMCKKCPAWRQGLVKIRHGGHLSRGKANDSRIGLNMSELVPRLGENLTRAGRQLSGKQFPVRVGNVWGLGENSTRARRQHLEKSATLLSLAPSTRRISGQASRAVPGRAWPLPGIPWQGSSASHGAERLVPAGHFL